MSIARFTQKSLPCAKGGVERSETEGLYIKYKQKTVVFVLPEKTIPQSLRDSSLYTREPYYIQKIILLPQSEVSFLLPTFLSRKKSTVPQSEIKVSFGYFSFQRKVAEVFFAYFLFQKKVGEKKESRREKKPSDYSDGYNF